MSEEPNAVTSEVSATSTTETNSPDLSTVESLLVALVAETYYHSCYAVLLLQTPGGLLETWKADAVELEKYSALAAVDYDFHFNPSERLVTILRGRIAEGFIPLGIANPGLDSKGWVGWAAIGFGLSSEAALAALRAYVDGFNRAMEYHGQDMHLVRESVKELFGDEGNGSRSGTAAERNLTSSKQAVRNSRAAADRGAAQSFRERSRGKSVVGPVSPEN